MSVESLIRITSWNVAGQQLTSGTMMDYLFEDNPSGFQNLRPDIEIVGLQEVSSFILQDPWTENLSTSLRKRGYILFKRHKLMGILLYIFVLREAIFRIRDLETESVRTGLGGFLGNKGGVSLRFNYNGNTFSVTNSHLAAHQEKLQDRIEDYKSIMEGTKFLQDSRTPGILDHEYSFWFGDLNFRFDDIDVNRVLNIISEYRASNSEDEKARILSALYQHDQLSKVRKDNLAFVNFTENPPKFLPTYKFQIGSVDKYDSEHRIPAWTDRVLYRKSKTHGTIVRDFKLDLEQVFYNSIPKMNLSDHKPVISMFKVATHDPKTVEATQLEYEIIKFEPIVGWKERQDGRLWYKIRDELFYKSGPKVLSSWDRIVLFRADFNSIDKYLTFVYPANMGKVAPRLDAQDVPYPNSREDSRSSSPNVSRQNSETSITQATEAISLNNNSDSSANIPMSTRVTEPIVEDGYKYFSATFPDEVLIPGNYIVMYLKVTETWGYNVYGMSEPFEVLSN